MMTWLMKRRGNVGSSRKEDDTADGLHALCRLTRRAVLYVADVVRSDTTDAGSAKTYQPRSKLGCEQLGDPSAQMITV